MMKLKKHLLPSWLKFAAASLVLLPVVPVCAQNAPAATTPTGPASPAQAKPAAASPAASPANGPTNGPAPAKAGAGKAAAAGTPAQAPDRAQAYYHMAMAGIYEDEAISQGQPDNINRAIEEYKLALNADPGSAELNDALAELYFRVPGRVHDAELTARGLLKISPDDIDAHKLLGRIYLRELGEGESAGSPAAATNNVLDQAIAEFERIVALQPKSVEDRMVLGQLYTVKHDPKKAEEEFRTAQTIEPESEEVVLNLAHLYADSGDMQHAAKVIEEVPVNDRTSKMEFTLGATYDQLKQPKDAIAAYQRAADMEPGDLHTMDALAQALLSNEQLDEALKQFKALAEADPENPEPWSIFRRFSAARESMKTRWRRSAKRASWTPPTLKQATTKACCWTCWADLTRPLRPTRAWSISPPMPTAPTPMRRRTTAASSWSGWAQSTWNRTSPTRPSPSIRR